MEIKHYTPAEEELLSPCKISCKYPECDSVFVNVGNLDLHVRRHHREQPPKRFDLKGKEYIFHCPQLNCVYNKDHNSKMYFKSLKYLRQHYQKVHVAKTYVCDQCGKAFVSSSQLKLHIEKKCGVKYICKDCGWDYNTLEALQTHGKRKGHKVRDDNITEKRQASRKGQVIELRTECEDRGTQTEALTPTKYIAQFSNLAGNNSETVHAEHLSTTGSPEPRHIETQTENQIISTLNTAFNTSSSTLHSSLSCAQIIPPSTHTYTQTYDDLFADSLLGLTDIQTQTNWSSFSDVDADTSTVDINQYNTPSAGTCTRCAYDELLVSTETQTSFTQCLLESRTTDGDTEDGTFGNLYQTQHTQTCDMLLGALFGAQESDLIGGFQSTYTQT